MALWIETQEAIKKKELRKKERKKEKKKERDNCVAKR